MNWIYKISKILTSLGLFGFAFFSTLLCTFFIFIWINNKASIFLGTMELDELSSIASSIFIWAFLLSSITLLYLCVILVYLVAPEKPQKSLDSGLS